VKWFGTAFREFASIFVPRNKKSQFFSLLRHGSEQKYESLLLFLFQGNLIPSCSKFSLLRKGLKYNSESFLFRGTTGILLEIIMCLVLSVFHGIIFVQSSRPWPRGKIPKFCIYRPCLLDMRTALASHLSQRSAADQ
jgi:hypothetical protein